MSQQTGPVTRLRPILLALTLILLSAAGLDTAHAQPGQVTRIRLGNPADVQPALTGPSFLLQGDGTPMATAFQAHIDQVAAAPLDIVVLAATRPGSGSPTPECDVLIARNNVNSCETVTIPLPVRADDPGATEAVSKAEIVYFAGGNQCEYVRWRGSTVHAAVQSVVNAGGGVGGGSAGLAIQGDVIYDGCTGSVPSQRALRNPYAFRIHFADALFNGPHLDRIITDSHFVARDRMGRLMSFVARQIQDGKSGAFYGLGIDDDSALVIDQNGLGTLYGSTAYVVLGDHAPEQCAPRQPLTFTDFKIWRIAAGGTYDFANRPTTGYYLRSVTNGDIDANPYSRIPTP